MKLSSLGHQTDLIFAKFESQIEEHLDPSGNPYLSIRTPEKPDYFWGNTLIFKSAPQPEDLKRWPKIYQQHFGVGADFMTFSWDLCLDEKQQAIAVAPFIKVGFEYESTSILKTEKLEKPARFNAKLDIRPLETEADWQAVVDVHINGHWTLKAEHERPFTEKQIKTARAMVNAKLGLRFGAFIGQKLVGDLGIYTNGQLGRFHLVATHKDHFRQGVCSSLMYYAGLHALNTMGLKTLVIAADKDDFPQYIYRSVGFQEIEIQPGLIWRNKQKYG